MSAAPEMNRGQIYTRDNEGVRYQTYDDDSGEAIGPDGLGVHTKRPLKGKLTIGVGHTGNDFKAGDIWNAEQVQTAFDADYHTAMEAAYSLIRNNCWNTIGEVRQAAIIDMCFQMGKKGVSEFVQMLLALQCMDYERAAREIMASQYATQAPTRALRNAKMVKTGIWQ